MTWDFTGSGGIVCGGEASRSYINMPSALSFVSTNKSFLKYTGAGLDFGTSDATFSCFLTPTGSDYRTIYCTGHQGDAVDFVWIYLELATNKIRVQINDGSGPYLYLTNGSTPSLVNGNLYHICVTFDRDANCTVWINGVAYDYGSISSKSGNINFGTTYVGVYNGGSHVLSGSVSFMRLWNRVLTSEEIARQGNMTGGIPYALPYEALPTSDKSNLVGCWDEPGYYYKQVSVTGSLDPDATGDYIIEGMYNGRPYYRRSDGLYYIWSDASYWRIMPQLGGNTGNRWARSIANDLAGDYFVPVGATSSGIPTVVEITSSGIYSTPLDSLNSWRDLHGTNHFTPNFSAIGPENPGLESDGTSTTFLNWGELANDGIIQKTTTAGEVFSGSAAAKLTAGNSKATLIESGGVSVSPGVSYRISVQTRDVGRLRSLGFPGSSVVTDWATGAAGTTYSLLASDLSVPTTPTYTTVRIQLWCPNVSGSFACFDEVDFRATNIVTAAAPRSIADFTTGSGGIRCGGTAFPATTDITLAVRLVGNDKSYLSNSSSLLAPRLGDFSAACFVKFTSVNTGNTQDVLRKTHGGTVPGWWIYEYGGGFRASFNDGVGTTLTVLPGISANVWYSVVLTGDRDGLMILRANSLSSSVDISSLNNDVTSERALTVGDTLDASVCYIRYWNRLLTSDEINRQMNLTGGLPRPRPYVYLSDEEKTGLVESWDEPVASITSGSPWVGLHAGLQFAPVFNPIISPTTGNGGFETQGVSPQPFANWLQGVVGASTVNDETSVIYSGGHACRLNVDASNNVCEIVQTNFTNGKLYGYTFYGRADSETPQVRVNAGAALNAHTLGTTYTQFSSTLRFGSTIFRIGNHTGAAGKFIYLDNVTLTAAEVLYTAGPEAVNPNDIIATGGLRCSGTAFPQLRKFASAANFIVSDKSWIKISSNETLQVKTTGMTLVCFAKWNGATSSLTLVSKDQSGNREYDLYIVNGRLTVTAWDSIGQVVTLSGGPILPSQTWCMCAMWYDPVRQKILAQVNNGQPTEVNFTGTPAALNADFCIGARLDGQFIMDGSVSHIRKWDRVLTREELLSQANVFNGTAYARSYSELTASEKVGLVSSWDRPGFYYNQISVTGNLSPDATGTYTVAGVYGSKPYYRRGNDNWYYWNNDGANGGTIGRWYLTNTLGNFTGGYWGFGSGTAYTEQSSLVGTYTGIATIAELINSGIYSTPLDSLNPWRDLHGTNHLTPQFFNIIDTNNLNGGFETAGSGGTDVFANWSEVFVGDSVIVRDTTTSYSGSASLRFDIDAALSNSRLNQNICTIGKLYNYSCYGKATSGTVWGGVYTPVGDNRQLSTSWTQYTGSFRAPGVYFGFARGSNAQNQSLWFDNVTLAAAEILSTTGPEIADPNNIVATGGLSCSGDATVSLTNFAVAAGFIASDKSWLYSANNPAYISEGQAITISAFIYLRSIPASNIYSIICKDIGSVREFGFYVNNDRRLGFEVFDSVSGVSQAWSEWGELLNTNQLYHVVGYYDPSDKKTRVVINSGSPSVASIALANGPKVSTTKYTVGSRTDSGIMDGTICQVRLWSRLLNAGEIARQANLVNGVPKLRPYAELMPSEKVGMISSWELDDGAWDSSHQAVDSHGTNHLSFTSLTVISPTSLNGDFETAGVGGVDLFANWTEQTMPNSVIESNTTSPYSGLAAIRLIPGDNPSGSDFSGAYSDFLLSAGKLYSYSVYAKADAGDSTLLYVGQWGAGYNFHTLTTSYVRYESTIRGPVSPQRKFGFLFPYVGRVADVDNIMLSAAEILTAQGPEIYKPVYEEGTSGISCGGTAVVPEVNRHWIAGTAKNWSDISAWSTYQGGPGGASAPTTENIVIFDGSGDGNCTFDGNIQVEKLISFSGYSGTIDLAGFNLSSNLLKFNHSGTLNLGTGNIAVNGSLDTAGATLDAGTSMITFQNTTSWNYSATQLYYDLEFNSVTITLPNHLTCNSLSTTASFSGTLDFNGRNVTTGDVTILGSGTIDAGEGIITCSGNWTWEGFTGSFLRVSSTVVLTGVEKTFNAPYGAGRFFYKLTFADGCSITSTQAVQCYCTGLCTINGTLNWDTQGYNLNMEGGCTQGLNGTVTGSGRLYFSGGTLSFSDSSLLNPASILVSRSVLLPPGVYSPTSSITFAAYSGESPIYNWSAGDFTFNSDVTLSCSGPSSFTFNTPGITHFTFNGNISTAEINGAITWDGSTAGTITLGGSNDQIIDAPSGILEAITINKTAGNVTLSNHLTCHSLTTLASWPGILDFNDFNVTTTESQGMVLAGSGSILCGNGTHTNRTVTFALQQGWTPETSTFVFTGVGTTSGSGGGKAFYNMTVAAGANLTGRVYCNNICRVEGTWTANDDINYLYGDLQMGTNGQITGTGSINLLPTGTTGGISQMPSTSVINCANGIRYSLYDTLDFIVSGRYDCLVILDCYNNQPNIFNLQGGNYEFAHLKLRNTSTGSVTVNAASPVLVRGNLTIEIASTGGIAMASADVEVRGNVVKQITGAGQFNANSTDISLTGSAEQTANFSSATNWGTVTFNNPSSTIHLAADLNCSDFDHQAGILDLGGHNITTTNDFNVRSGALFNTNSIEGTTWTIGGDCDIQGTPNSKLDLKVAGVWYLNVAGTATADWVDVSGSDANGGDNVFAIRSFDWGDNFNWEIKDEIGSGGVNVDVPLYMQLFVSITPESGSKLDAICDNYKVFYGEGVGGIAVSSDIPELTTSITPVGVTKKRWLESRKNIQKFMKPQTIPTETHRSERVGMGAPTTKCDSSGNCSPGGRT